MVFLSALCIALWAWLWTGKLKEPGQIGAPIDALIQRLLKPERQGWRMLVYKPLALCGTCHAGWFAILYVLFNLQTFTPWPAFCFVILAMGTAEILSTWQ